MFSKELLVSLSELYRAQTDALYFVDVLSLSAVGGLENGGGRMRAAWASEVFMDGGLAVSCRCLFDDQLLGARTETTRKRRAVLMAC